MNKNAFYGLKWVKTSSGCQPSSCVAFRLEKVSVAVIFASRRLSIGNFPPEMSPHHAISFDNI